MHPPLWGEIIIKENFLLAVEKGLPSAVPSVVSVGPCSLVKIHSDPEWPALGHHGET